MRPQAINNNKFLKAKQDFEQRYFSTDKPREPKEDNRIDIIFLVLFFCIIFALSLLIDFKALYALIF